MRELNDDANAAMGTLLALFHPDCNAHRELSSWFEENVTAALPQHDRGRMDYNFRNAWVNFYARYQPNKQVNLDTILKRWEASTMKTFLSLIFMGSISSSLVRWSSSGSLLRKRNDMRC